MKARNQASSKIIKTIDRFVQLLKSKEPDKIKDLQSKNEVPVRVTDDAGDEFLCPVRDLKNPNFVEETEKANCISYNRLSKPPIE
jgi:hypothetical protein